MTCLPLQDCAVHLSDGGEDAVGRLRVAGVRVERMSGRIAVTVGLMHGEATLTASVERPAAESQGVQVAAEAALEALRQVAPSGTRFVLLRTANLTMNAGPAVVTQVLVETPRGHEQLVGSALCRGRPLEDAAAEAVLDAVGRRLIWLLRT